MKVLEIDEIRAVQLELLNHVKNVCEKEGIQWFLCGGTLLGAVRHKGYIPWDDDIDIVLPRPDYRRLINALKTDTGSVYAILDPYTDKDYHSTYVKLIDTRTKAVYTGSTPFPEKMGVYIDIFPFDGVPDEERERVQYYKELVRLSNRHGNSIRQRTLSGWKERLKWMIKLPYIGFCRMVGTEAWKQHLLEAMERYDYQTCDKIGHLLSIYGLKDVFDKSCFGETVEVEFEGQRYPGPCGCHEYLSALYGDYMTLPPENKRVSTHDTHYYWR